MADPVAEKMSQASAEKMPQTDGRHETKHAPHKGDQYRCERCGMELTVTADCKCRDVDHVHLECCGHEMTLT
jgi:hypothetical protein